MSDHIAHLGICDDTFRLAGCHAAIDPTFKQIMDQRRDDAHMGAVTRSADYWSAEMIVQLREQFDRPDAERDPLAASKLAFVLGALTHRSADRHTKPITRCWDGDDDAHGDANESKIMQDIFVFKEVYDSGRDDDPPGLSRRVLRAFDDEGEASVEMAYRVMLRRALIAMHTLNPDKQHIDDWLNAFFGGLQTFPKSLNLYARLAAEWDPAKVKRYLIDKHFYSRDDVLIRLARDIQRGSTPPPGAVEQAIDQTDRSSSRYARSLARAIDYLLAAGDLFNGRIDLEEAKNQFDIGVPELALQD